MAQRFGMSARQLKGVFSTTVARRRAQQSSRSSSLIGLAATLSVAILLALTTSAVAESPGLVAAYSLDAGSGTLAKDSAGTHDGTIAGGATWTEGKFGKALDFDGQNDCVNVPNDVDLQLTESFTLEAWVNPDTNSGYGPIFFKEIEEGSESYSLFVGSVQGGRLEGYVNEGSWEWSEVESPQVLPAKTWSHIALTSDGTTLRLYLNGNQIDSDNVAGAMESPGPLTIGCAEHWNSYFDGKIDEARIYNRALSQEEVKADKDSAIQTAPQAVSGSAAPQSATEAILSGVVNPKGGSTTYYFEYGPTSSYGSKSPATPKAAGNGSGDIDVAQPVSGLTGGSEYHFRLVATNEAGTTKGADKNFVMPEAPEATTEGPLEVLGTEAVLAGSIDSNGENTEYSFEYGQTPAYGSTIVAEDTVLSDEPFEAEEGIVGLQPETTYHYRLVATNPGGSDVGPDREFTTTAASPSISKNIDAGFYGVHWGHPHEMDEPKGADMAWCAGAGMVRIQLLHPELPQSMYENIFRLAAERKITILPHVGAHLIEQENAEGKRPKFRNEVREAVEIYGRGGTMWKKYPGLAEWAPLWWEVWNEPNYKINANYNGVISPAVYGDLLEETANAIHNENADPGAKILVGGLLSVGGNEQQRPPELPPEQSWTPEKYPVGKFIEKMGHADDYDAVGVHPYAFKGSANKAPETGQEIGELIERVEANLREARRALPLSVPIWITEIGWPTPGPGYEGTGDNSHYPVSAEVQGKLIDRTFDMFERKAGTGKEDFNIDKVIYYHLQDVNYNSSWDQHTGLRPDYDANGESPIRAAWTAFQQHARFPATCPQPPKNKHKSRQVKARQLIETTTLNSYRSSTQYWIKWKQGPAPQNPSQEQYQNFTNPLTLEQASEQDVDANATVNGLQPETTYHYRVVAKNDAGQKTESPAPGQPALEIATPEATSVTASTDRVLHGQPGHVWIGGWVKEGPSGPGIPAGEVRVNFKRDPQEPAPIETVKVDLHQGQFETGFVVRGSGHWYYKVVYPAQLGYDQGETKEFGDFWIHDGVRIIAKHSQKCMDVAGASTADGTAIMQGTCLPPTTAQNQVFSLLPKPDGYEVVARHSGKCLDVEGAITSDGARIAQYGCVGAVHLNQEFDETWWGPSQYAYYSPKHAVNKCLEVQGANAGWAPFQQATCTGADHQLLRLEPVDSGPIPTQTSLTIDQVLHGSPGLVSAKGYLTAGTYSMASRVVRIEFDNATTPGWDSSGGNLPVNVDGSGYYEFRDFPVPAGYWNIRARFVGGAEFAESTSGTKSETIKRGYLVVNRHSNMCLAVSENKSADGTPFIQWPCSAVNGNGQVISFWPRGGWYEVRVNGSNKCLDVWGAGTQDGAWLQLGGCVGPNHSNQHWDREPIGGQPGWYALIAKHSGKCASNTNMSNQAGTRIIQWNCGTWPGNMQWALQGVINP